jgi:hypothetical protein
MQARIRPWLTFSIVIAVVAMVGSVIGLAVERIYALETRNFETQSIAQDLVNLFVVSPVVIVSALVARRGSVRAAIVWIGALLFNVYNYVIYAFSIHLGPLSLLWIAVLGASTYTVGAGLLSFDFERVGATLRDGRVFTVTAWFMMTVAVLFALVWLREDVPAILRDEVPKSLRDTNLPSNPVHVLDLALALPAVFATGWFLRTRRPWTLVVAPALLVLLALIGLPILVTPFVQAARGDTADWQVFPMFLVITAVLVVLITGLLRRIGDRVPQPA